MGQKKVDTTKLIKNPATRRVTFRKRKEGLFKKCGELSQMCNATVLAYVRFPDTGEFFALNSDDLFDLDLGDKVKTDSYKRLKVDSETEVLSKDIIEPK